MPENLIASSALAQGTEAQPCRGTFELDFDYLYLSLRRLGVPEVDVEYFAHEVFLVLRRCRSVDGPSEPLRPWLFRIVFRVALIHRKRLERTMPRGSLELDDRAPQREQASGPQEEDALVLAGLARVPLLRRAALILHDFDQVPIRHVASALGISLATAHSRLGRARIEFKLAVKSIQARGGRR